MDLYGVGRRRIARPDPDEAIAPDHRVRLTGETAHALLGYGHRVRRRSPSPRPAGATADQLSRTPGRTTVRPGGQKSSVAAIFGCGISAVHDGNSDAVRNQRAGGVHACSGDVPGVEQKYGATLSETAIVSPQVTISPKPERPWTHAPLDVNRSGGPRPRRDFKRGDVGSLCTVRYGFTSVPGPNAACGRLGLIQRACHAPRVLTTAAAAALHVWRHDGAGRRLDPALSARAPRDAGAHRGGRPKAGPGPRRRTASSRARRDAEAGSMRGGDGAARPAWAPITGFPLALPLDLVTATHGPSITRQARGPLRCLRTRLYPCSPARPRTARTASLPLSVNDPAAFSA